MIVSAVRQRNARKKSIREESLPCAAASSVDRKRLSFWRWRKGSTRVMAALEKKGDRNSLRFFVSERVCLDWREPVRKGLPCQMRVKGVPTRKILEVG
jgi:hypothetical protein